MHVHTCVCRVYDYIGGSAFLHGSHTCSLPEQALRWSPPHPQAPGLGLVVEADISLIYMRACMFVDIKISLVCKQCISLVVGECYE